MATVVSEHLDQEVRGAVDDLGLAREALGARDEASDAHDPHVLEGVVTAAQRVLDQGQAVDRAEARGLVGIIDADLSAHLARTGQGSARHGQLARDVDPAVLLHHREVVGHRRIGLGKGNAERREARLNRGHERLLLS
ncbi:hypothetical protein D3C86_1782840 [compost metagenome]